MPELSSQEVLDVFRELGKRVPATLEGFRELTSSWSAGEGANLRKQRGEQHERYEWRCRQFRSIEQDFTAHLDGLYAEFRRLSGRLLGMAKVQPLTFRDGLRSAAVEELRLSDELVELFLACLTREQGIDFREIEQCVPPSRSERPPSRSERPPSRSESSAPPAQRSWPRSPLGLLAGGSIVLLVGWLMIGPREPGAPAAAPVPRSAAAPAPNPVTPSPPPRPCTCDYPGASCEAGGPCRLDAGRRWALTPYAMSRAGSRGDGLSAHTFSICVSASPSGPESCSDPATGGVKRDASHLTYYFTAPGNVVVTTEQLEGRGIDVTVKEDGQPIAGASGYAYGERDNRRLVAGKLLFSGGLVVALEHAYVTNVVLRFAPVVDAPAAEEPRSLGTHPWIGVGLRDLDAEQRRAVGIDYRAGALVASVREKGPASLAGVAEGDVVLAVATHVVAGAEDVQRSVRSSRPGVPLSLEILRGGRRFNLQVAPAPPAEPLLSGDTKP